MIHHISIGVHDPEHVAAALAEVLGGMTAPFPDAPGAHIAFAADDHGTLIEVQPIDMELRPGTDGEGLRMERGSARNRFGPFHAAISVAHDVEALQRLGERLGWRTAVQSRGPFHVVELWIENEVMLELLPPVFAAEYLAALRLLSGAGATAR
jgi:hypothetical protein